MAKLRLYVRPSRWTEKGNRILIALSHRGETMYIKTVYTLSNAKQWRDGRVVYHERSSEINRKLLLLLSDYELRVEEIGMNLDNYTCRQLRDILINKNAVVKEVKSTYSDVLREYVSELREDGKLVYADMLEWDYKNRFYIFAKDILLCCITPKLIADYSRYLYRRGFAPTTVGISMRNVRTIVNRAVRLQYVKYDVYPFISVSIPTGAIREIDIDIDTLNKIRKAEPQKDRLRMARDLFMLSFYCGGMNIADIVNADWSKDRLEYVRHKTRNRTQGVKKICIAIPDEAREIINRYIGSDGRLKFGYKFTYRNFVNYVGRIFKMLIKELDIDNNVIMYSARKTWAQMAMELGIGESIIDYCLGHSDSRRGVIRYYTRVKERMADVAIRTVIDYVFGRITIEEKSMQIMEKIK